MIKRSIALTSAIAVSLLTGCASEQMQKEINEVRIIAQEAKATADKSMEKAEEASAAMAKAEAAMSAAEAAQACCDDSRERLDRVFRKSMNK
jgi:membrane-bound lytic murein transglycosylase